MVTSRVGRTVNKADDDERRRGRLVSATRRICRRTHTRRMGSSAPDHEDTGLHLEDEDGEFEVNTLSGPQPVKLSHERCDVLAPTFPVDQSSGGVKH